VWLLADAYDMDDAWDGKDRESPFTVEAAEYVARK
jgi:hypothetical protein